MRYISAILIVAVMIMLLFGNINQDRTLLYAIALGIVNLLLREK